MLQYLCWDFNKIKIYFFLLSISVDELISTPIIIGFLPFLPPGNEKLPSLSISISYRQYLYLLISSILVQLTAPNKQFSSVG